jgi:hypothetical protein
MAFQYGYTFTNGEQPNATKWDQVFRNDDALYDAMNAASATYTPTFTNFTLGNGTLSYCRYVQVGKKVKVWVRVILGSTSSMGTTPQISLPVTARALVLHAPIGFANLQDTGTNQFKGLVNYYDTTHAFFQQLAVTGSNIIGGTITSTAPFTWTTSDEFHLTFEYEAA